MLDYDVIVVGAGHAGCEAALASARLGAQTLLLTISPDTIAAMSCNPAIGGPAAKSHLVRELDALGGEMAKAIDNSYLNIRRINETRGPAVLALRAQADKKLYQTEMTTRLERQANLFLKQGTVTDILIENDCVIGVILKSDRKYLSKVVILATGTFLDGHIVMGNIRYSGGRQGEPACPELSASLKRYGLKLRRFQTATPPRINRQTVNFDKLIPQPIHNLDWGFSWDGLKKQREQLPCWITTTTPATIQVIQENIHHSPIYSGSVTTKGPHFCPSIDRKVIKFPNKTDHLIFLEPEGIYTEELYLLGLTTAMPEEVQERILSTIPGLEKADIIRPGYAVEYDCFEPFQFDPSLESKLIKNLFSAGQINGTSGYEEAAAQGIIAGINAAHKAFGIQPYIPSRTSSYIGVLIDDLATKSTDEPYRMMTSFAEYRLFLRLDNSLIRLGEEGSHLGLWTHDRLKLFNIFKEQVFQLNNFLDITKIKPNAPFWQKSSIINNCDRGYRLKELILHPEIGEEFVLNEFPEIKNFLQPVRDYVFNELKLAGYLKRQNDNMLEVRELESFLIPTNFSFKELKGLSASGLRALQTVKPLTLGQALRISDMNEADRALLLLKFKKVEGVISCGF